MFSKITESLKITNNFLIIATPLILFSLISNVYILFTMQNNGLKMIFPILLLVLMLSMFLSGWFYMITKAVKEPDMENKDSLMSEFLSGVGEYFLSILGMLFGIGILSSAAIFIAVIVGKNIIGNPGISQQQLALALSNVEAMKAFISSLNHEQLVKISSWNILLLVSMIINYILILFYAPTIFFKNKNPFFAFFISLKDFFSLKFLKNIGLFIFICVSYLLISGIMPIAGKNVVLYFILTLINFYYLTFITIHIFNYYYSNYAKIGSNVDEVV